MLCKLFRPHQRHGTVGIAPRGRDCVCVCGWAMHLMHSHVGCFFMFAGWLTAFELSTNALWWRGFGGILSLIYVAVNRFLVLPYFLYTYFMHICVCVCTLFIAVCGTPNACGALSAHDSVCGKIRCKFQVP